MLFVVRVFVDCCLSFVVYGLLLFAVCCVLFVVRCLLYVIRCSFIRCLMFAAGSLLCCGLVFCV